MAVRLPLQMCKAGLVLRAAKVASRAANRYGLDGLLQKDLSDAVNQL